MPADPTLIASLERAVAASPEDLALRLHLANLLLEAGRPGDALAHCDVVLVRDGDHAEAAELAADAREALADAAEDADDDGEDDATPKLAEVVPLRVIRGGDAEDDPPAELERPRITLADVGGMEKVKKRLQLAFLGPMKNPELRKMYGKSLRGGLLLYGPPGCGKTHIARALAGELGAGFLNVGLNEVLDMYFGQSERNLHEIFETARRSAPCVVFLDELDALGHKRRHLRHSGGRSVVNQLLAELDNVSQSNEGVFVLAATNHPWDIDVALRRPGRLDRTVLVTPPDREARTRILEIHLRDRPTRGLDLAWLARRTEGYSGADLAHLCESAAEHVLAEALETDKARPLRRGDFKRALKEVKRSTDAWFQGARNYALYANEGGVFDDLLTYLRGGRRE